MASTLYIAYHKLLIIVKWMESDLDWKLRGETKYNFRNVS